MTNPMDPIRREAILEMARRREAAPQPQYRMVPQPPITMDLTQEPPERPMPAAAPAPAPVYHDAEGNAYPVQRMDFGEQSVPGLTGPLGSAIQQELSAPVDDMAARAEAIRMARGGL